MRVPTSIYLDEMAFNRIDRLNSADLAHVYAAFFRGLWARGCQLYKSEAQFSSKVSGTIVYLKLTPKWPREEVTFVRGNNMESGFPFMTRELPDKNTIRTRNNKRIGCAILVEWLSRRESGCEYMLALLESKGVRIDLESITHKEEVLLTLQSDTNSIQQRQSNAQTQTSVVRNDNGFALNPTADLNASSGSTSACTSSTSNGRNRMSVQEKDGA